METPIPSHSPDSPDILVNELVRHGVRDMLQWAYTSGSVLSSPSARDAVPLLEPEPGVLLTEADENVRELVHQRRSWGRRSC